MEAMLGISLCSYPISTSKNALFFLLLLMSSLQQNWRKKAEQVLPGSEGEGEGGWEEKWPKQCMHM
jgi:hypothetical protein